MSPVSTVDAEGVDRVLQKHSALIQRHVTSALRKQHQKG
jgi:hypothetical protein